MCVFLHGICTSRIQLSLFKLSLNERADAALPAPQPVVVLEAVALTAAIVGSLTAYSFYATRTGKDFRWAVGATAPVCNTCTAASLMPACWASWPAFVPP